MIIKKFDIHIISIISLFIMMFLVLIMSCNKLDTGRDGIAEKKEKELTSTGFVDFSFTRNDELPEVNFKNTDSIGLFAYNNITGEVKRFVLTMKNNKWDPKIRRNELGEGDIILSVYYPMSLSTVDNPNNYTYTIRTDQSGEGYTQSKIFFSKTELGRKEEKVNLNLNNLMCQLEINIESSSKFPDLTVKLRKSITKAKISLLNGNIETSPGAKKEREDIIPHKVSEGKYKVVLVPQSTDYYQKNGLIQATYSSKITQINAPLTIEGKPFKVFKSGSEDAANVNLENNTIKIIPKTKEND